MRSRSPLRTLTLLVLFAATVSRASVYPSAAVADGLIPIYEIQGAGMASALTERWIDTYGVVTAVVANGFYLQDPIGDGNLETSDGIYVYTNKPPTVQVGQCVGVQRAYVDEFYEKTELSRLKAVAPVDVCPTITIAPLPIAPPRWGVPPVELLERYEGMVVQVQNLTGVVHGPTKRFADGSSEIALLPTPLTTYLDGERLFHTAKEAIFALVHLSSAQGDPFPAAAWGDQVTVGRQVPAGVQTTAILDYNFGKYQLILMPGETIAVAPRTPIEEQGVASTMADFTICSMNLYAFGRGSAQITDEVEYRAHLRQHALVINERLQGCTVIGLQEAGTPEDVENLVNELSSVFGLAYTASALPGPQTHNPEFPLTNAIISRADRVQVRKVESRQSCSPTDYEVIVLPSDCPTGQFALFDRPPLLVDLTITGDWGEPYPLRVISNHFKSKAGDETVNVIRRMRQAHYIATLVQEALAADPAAHVVVLGDLNDFYSSEPVEALRTAVQPPLVHTYDFLPALDRFTYIFNGASQALDHILISQNMLPALASVDPIHINANFPYPAKVDFTAVHHASDHDPVQVRIRPAGAAVLGGNLRYPGIHIELLDTAQQPIAETLTDRMGDFRFWGLTPGAVTLRISTPNSVYLSSLNMALSLQTGYNTLNLPVAHQAVEVGIAAALLAPVMAQR